MTSFFTTSDGARLAYKDEGTGTPLLCLTGLTRNMQDFDYVMPHLPPCRVIRMDYRGRGESQWTGAETYTIPHEARDALELLDHLGIAKAAVLGTSRGGMIAMLLAALAKDRLTGIAFNDIGPELSKGGLERIKDYVGRNPGLNTHAELAEVLPKHLPGFSNMPEGRWLEDAKMRYTEAPEGLRINYDPALRDAVLAAFDGPEVDAWPLFDACAGLPLALIRGANSDLLPSACADEMRRRRPDMAFADVPDRAHVPYLDEPEAIAVVLQFLTAVQQAAPEVQ